MTKYIESVVGDEGKILIEVSDSTVQVGFGTAQAEKSDGKKNGKAFNQALNTIRLAAGGILETLKTLDERPDTAQISFALKFNSDEKVMLARSGSDAQLTVSLTWNTDKAKDKAAESGKKEK
jgi:hypothetical protein